MHVHIQNIECLVVSCVVSCCNDSLGAAICGPKQKVVNHMLEE